MKTIKKEAQIKRVQDSQAESFIRRGWTYCAKNEWKTKVRDYNPNHETDKLAIEEASKISQNTLKQVTEPKKKFKKGTVQKKGK